MRAVFIGGTADGQVIDIPDGRDTWRIPVPGTNPAPMIGTGPLMPADGAVNVHSYRRERLTVATYMRPSVDGGRWPTIAQRRRLPATTLAFFIWDAT